MKIAFLGTGLMGSGFVRRLLENGHEVNVWNRKAEKARALEGYGAKAYDTAEEAAAGVDRIHLALADDASVDAVLEPLADGLPAETWIIDHTTTAPGPTAERCARWASRGRVYLHAPVFMGPMQAQTGAGVMLISGDPGQCATVLPELQRMAGSVVNLGPQTGMAASYKLFGNLTLIGMSGVLADVIRLAASVGIPPRQAVGLFQQFNPGQFLPHWATRIAEGPYEPPSFTVAMGRKDVRLMQETAARGGVDLVVTEGVAALLDAAVARGEGEMDIMAGFRWPA